MPSTTASRKLAGVQPLVPEARRDSARLKALGAKRPSDAGVGEDL
jgi:hypothetical protein